MAPATQHAHPVEHVTYGDPFAPEHRANPYVLYRRIRENDPVHRALDGSWVVSRWADGTAVLRDPRFSGSPEWLAEGDHRAENNPIRQVGTSLMMFLDPPDHTRLRSLVSKAFTPKRVEAMRPRVQRLVDELLDAVVEQGEMDVLGDLAYPLPTVVICELLGVPPEDHEVFAAWSEAAVRLLDPGDELEPMQAANAAVEGFEGYFHALFEQRRRDPGDDLLSALTQAEDGGDRLSPQELMSMAVLLLVAGHETTVNLIGNGVVLLLRHPDELARLRADPALAPTAVEECLRYESPIQITGRYAKTALEVAGHTFDKGAPVMTLLAAANRDPRQFPDADRFDIGRRDNHHLAFSNGAHFCLGATLARLETEVALTRLVTRFPTLELAADPVRRDTINLRGLAELRLTVA